MDNLSDKQFWDDEWKQEVRSNEEKYINNYYLNPLLKKFLPIGGKTYFEIGCAPGTTLVNFAKNFHYRVSGIDFSSRNITSATLNRHNVTDYELYDDDFLNFQTEQTYGVVASYGFVEHFVDYHSIIAKQASLVEPDGYLVVEVPNIRYFNYFLFSLFDPSLIKLHNLKVMDRKEISQVIRENEEFDLLFCNYYKSCFLFFNSDNPELSSRPILKKCFNGLRKLFQMLGLENIPNKFFSPYLILIAKRRSRITPVGS